MATRLKQGDPANPIPGLLNNYPSFSILKRDEQLRLKFLKKGIAKRIIV
jgi:hypothetical protein